MDRIRNTRRTILICVLLAAATLAVYWPVIHYQFVNLDDPAYVTQNVHVLTGLTWANVLAAFRVGYAGNWHPLTWFSHILDAQIFGMNAGGHHLTSVVFHVLNTILLFLVLRRMTARIVGDDVRSLDKPEVRSQRSEVRRRAETPYVVSYSADWRCAFVAALFALHPLHVESVAWVSERKDVLSAFFFFLTLYAYTRYAEGRKPKAEIREPTANSGNSREKAQKAQKVRKRMFPLRLLRFFAANSASSPTGATPVPAASFGSRISGFPRISAFGSRPWYFAALLFFALGLMAKPMLVTLPFLLLLLDYWPLGRFAGGKQKLESPQRLVTSSPTVQASKFKVQGSTVSPARSPLPAPLLRLLFEKLPFLLLSAASCAVTFVAQKQEHAVVALEVVSVGHRLENAVLSCVAYLQKMAWPVSLAAYYPFRKEIADEDAFAAVLFLLGVTAVALYWGVRRARPSRPYLAVGWLWYLGMLVPVIGVVQVGAQAMADRYTYLPLIGIFIAVTWTVADWKTKAESRNQKAETGRSSTAEYAEYAEKERKQKGDLTTSLSSEAQDSRLKVGSWTFKVLSPFRVFRVFRGFNPAFSSPQSSILVLLSVAVLAACAWLTRAQVKTWANNETFFRHTIEVTGRNPFAIMGLGEELAGQRRYPEAIEQYAEAIRISPNYAEPQAAWGRVLAAQGKLDEAIVHYRAAVKVDPTMAKGRFLLANGLLTHGQPGEAIEEYRAAIALDPSLHQAYNDLAWLRATAPEAALRDSTQAVELAQRACDLTGFLRPQYIGTLAAAYAEAGRFDDAVKAAEKAKALAAASGETNLVQRNEELLGFYRARKAYHETNSANTERH